MEHTTPVRMTASRATGVQPRPLRWWTTRIVTYTLLILFLAVFLVPFLWLASLALKTQAEFADNPFGLPVNPQWSNFEEVWTNGRYNTYLPNTILYAVTVVIGVCAFACLTGYALAKIRFPGRQFIFLFLLFGITVPFQSRMIPLFYLTRDLGILGRREGYIIPSIALGLPFGVFLMRAFFSSIPDELADAARVDGCTQWGVFRWVMLPLAGPGLTTLAVFQFLFTWTAFLPPLVLLQRDALRPVALALLFFTDRQGANLPLVATGTIITILPVILAYLVLQRKFIEGITAGALK